METPSGQGYDKRFIYSLPRWHMGPAVKLQLPNESGEETANKQVIEHIVAAFAKQDLETIMTLFADDAVYYDVEGGGIRGKAYRGKEAIWSAFHQQFSLLPRHSYEDAIIFVSGNKATANWTLVIGNPDAKTAFRTRGCDYFELRDGKITVKDAWIMNLAATRRAAFRYKFIEWLGIE